MRSFWALLAVELFVIMALYLAAVFLFTGLGLMNASWQAWPGLWIVFVLGYTTRVAVAAMARSWVSEGV